MAGPVRPAYRSREAGEGGIDVRARVRPPRPRGRWVRRIRGHVIARPVPPAPRSSAVVDPRIGDLGPALLALEDGTVFPGVAFGAPVAAGGDLVVNTSQTGYQEVCTDPSYAGQVVVMTYPLIGNYGRLADDDQSIRPWLRGLVVANATAAVLDDARQLAALLRDDGHPGDRRRRHAGAGAPPARERLPARHRDRARRDRPGGRRRRRPGACPRWEDQDFVGQVSPPAVTDYRRPADGRPAGRDRRLRAQGQHRPRDAPPRGARPGPAAHGDRGRGPRRRRRRRHPVARPGRSGPARGPVALARAVIDDGRPLLGICLGHQIVGRAAGADTTPAAVRPPRREPPGPGPRARASSR